MRSTLLVLPSFVILLASTASAQVVIDWVTVGDPGNACDVQTEGCFGAVSVEFQIGEYEVTNAQYTAFLNAVAATDTNSLYIGSMAFGVGGITRTGSSGSYIYAVRPGRGSMPVNYVSFWSAARLANWMHNGQPTGLQDNSTTEEGAYTLTPTGIANNTVARNPGAAVFLPSEDEWYKAAYYETSAMLYFDYPEGSDTPTTCAAPGATPNTANCTNAAAGDVTDVGSYTAGSNPNGTFDQGGNESEWNETPMGSGNASRGRRGGHSGDVVAQLAASTRSSQDPSLAQSSGGIRLASPAPASSVPLLGPFGVMMLCGVLGVVGSRRLRGVVA